MSCPRRGRRRDQSGGMRRSGTARQGGGPPRSRAGRRVTKKSRARRCSSSNKILGSVEYADRQAPLLALVVRRSAVLQEEEHSTMSWTCGKFCLAVGDVGTPAPSGRWRDPGCPSTRPASATVSGQTGSARSTRSAVVALEQRGLRGLAVGRAGRSAVARVALG